MTSKETKEFFPDEIIIKAHQGFPLRYGENPHQQAAIYFEEDSTSPLKNLKHIAGREPSVVNITDINAGIESVRQFDGVASVVIKHNTPCGIALGDSTKESIARAIEADPESAFGGVIVSNHKIDLESAMVIAAFKDDRKSNIDIVASTGVDQEAISLLRATRKTMGIYTFGNIPKDTPRRNIKWIDGGFIVQTEDRVDEGFDSWKLVTNIEPTSGQLSQMMLGWKFISRMKSNAVLVMDRDLPMTRGIGTGQTSRIRATKIALEQAGNYAQGAVLVSDSFFPFSDSVVLAAERGISAVVQQGGSLNDKFSIEAADKAGIAMIFTHRRAFWH